MFEPKDMNRIRVAGLDLPQVVELVWKLREKGIKIKEQVFSEEELMDFLKSFIHQIKISHLIRVTSVQSFRRSLSFDPEAFLRH